MATFFAPKSSWEDEKIWIKIAKHEGMDNPFEAKCLYVFGTIRHLMYAANKLYPDHSLPACILGFNSIELLGRCLLGHRDDHEESKKRIKAGLRYIAGIKKPGGIETLCTDEGKYVIPNKALVKIRNFTAHGFYGSDEKLTIDNLLIAWLFGAVGDAIQRYYEELKEGDKYEKMLEAKIQPLTDKNGKPIRIKPIQKDLEGTNIEMPLSQPGGQLKGKNWNWHNDYEDVKSMNDWFLPREKEA